MKDGATEPRSSDELIGDLAHQLSALIRSDLELSALERGHLLRRVTVEVAVTVFAGFVLLIALGAFGWAAILGLATVVPRAIAALLVGGGWVVVAVLLLRFGPPRRLWRRLTHETHEQRVLSARSHRRKAEKRVRETSAGLGHAIVRGARDHELRAAAAAAERMGAAAEHEMEAVLRELGRAFNVPARAGRKVFGRFRSPGDERAPEP